MVGAWYQSGFHPIALGVAFIQSLVLAIVGAAVREHRDVVGSVLLAVAASIFRFNMTAQWALYIWEAKGPEGRPGGNSLLNITGLPKLLGHLSIQLSSTIAVVSGGFFVVNFAEALKIDANRRAMLSVS